MKKESNVVLKTAVAAVFGLSMAGSAQAVPFGDGGAALQGVLDGITVAPTPGSSSVNVATDHLADGIDSWWSITGAGGSVASIIVELAAFANGNELGVYDPTNPGSQVTVFTGAAVAGSQAFLSIKVDGSVFVNNVDSGVDFNGNFFGYFLNVTNTGNKFYSDTNLNFDNLDHLAVYQGTNTDTIQVPTLAPGLWTNNEFVMAWEDLAAPVSDRDYTDMVLIVESVIPVPEPSILALLGLGMLGFVGSRRLNKA
ncbi:DUF4114 domain-containing protein [Nitrosomonas marina]|uniref:PEP-CTERM protein-sorting domain-containing protein n=1 Tax=Nitrosomonas marina TaxID=917 RepID=A0A1H8BU83_9PROT|nr:DUF4114 domain-containing protein [Nitrosomonas marina]SEM86343.1 PEP-CTERM protein-sorting domain-containing protein [Nitrosomonas marina]